MYIRNPTAKASTAKPDSSDGNSGVTSSVASSPVPSSGNQKQQKPQLAEEKYTPVLKKFTGTSGWPQQAIILPGHEILFSLETASDYVKYDKVKKKCNM